MTKKKCRGTGKAAGHGCGSLVTNRKYGLGLSCGCWLNWLKNTPEGQEVVRKNTLTAQRKTKRERTKKQTEQKEKNKSISSFIQDARKPFQEYIRLRDANETCISCGRDSKIWDGGHYFKAELYSGLIFDEVNVNKQCGRCNRYLDGNIDGYKSGLINKYGYEAFLSLSERAIALKEYKYTKDELKAIKRLYIDKIKQLKNNLN